MRRTRSGFVEQLDRSPDHDIIPRSAFGRRELLEVIDLSEFVAEQREWLAVAGVSALVMPWQRVYRPAVAKRLRPRKKMP
jgi:hypothetical protein